MLRQSKNYQCFKINSHCFKFSLFADYARGNLCQWERYPINYVFNILNYFGNKSGCKVNLYKSSAFYIGSSREKKKKF